MSYAIREATKLNEIGFPEFTAKLITDTFDALISANIRQTEAYSALVKATSQDIGTYINETKDDIDGAMILQFLAGVTKEYEKVAEAAKDNTPVTLTDSTALAAAVTLPGETAPPAITTKGEIFTAVAKRIAADKYTMLKEMVKMGILRLVVETGVIETKLTFNTYTSSYYSSNSSKYNSSTFSVKASAKTGSFVSLWCKASASTAYNSVSISTANSSSSSSSGTNIQICGLVRINFKTDYQQLSTT